MPPSKSSILGRAAAILAARKPTPTTESAEEWAAKAIDARRRSFWSAKLFHAQHVADLKQACLGVLREDKIRIRDLHSSRWTPEELEVEVDPVTMKVSPGSGVKRGDVEMTWTRSLMIDEMRARAKERGLDAQAKPGRIRLIEEMAVGMSVGRAKWEDESADKTGLEVAPARRLVRVAPRKVPRDWETRWREGADAVKWEGVYDKDGGATKIAMFNSPIWVAISAFGEPFPPFDYNSGMGVEPVFAYELTELGWYPNQPPPNKEKKQVEIDISDLDKTEMEWLAKELGDIAKIEDGKLKIGQGNALAMAAKQKAEETAQVAVPEEPQKAAPRFVPAQSLGEAEQYAEKHFAVTANLRGMSLEHANKVNEALAELTERYPIRRLQYVKQNGRMRSYARASWQTLEINESYIGERLENEAKTYAAQKERIIHNLTEAVNRYGSWDNIPTWERHHLDKMAQRLKFSRWCVDNSHERKIAATVAHEYGHIISDQYFGMINGARANSHYLDYFGLTGTDAGRKIYETNERWKKAFAKAKKNGDIYGISEYASTDRREFFAECFAAHFMGEKLPDYIETLLLEVLRNGIL